MLGNQIIEVRNPVFLGIEQPGRIVNPDQCIQGKGLSQMRISGDLLAIFINLLQDLIQKIDRGVERSYPCRSEAPVRSWHT